jgi:RHS repeat-associated protein
VETGSPGDDPWYWFAHDERWRIVATFRHEDSTAKERFVWHSAGPRKKLDGHGGSSYIDSVILRDKDANTAWTSAADGTLEERLYYAQNWRADVSLVLSSTGQLKERVKYSAYGVPFCISPADYNGDAAVDQFDYLDFMADYDAENVRADINFDGTTDFYDYLDYIAEYDSGNGESGGGRSSLSRASINNRIGYAGYQWDPSIRGSITGTGGASAGKYHVRHRVLDAGQGRWTKRDPLDYIDGTNLYEYVDGDPITQADPTGLYMIFFPSIILNPDVFDPRRNKERNPSDWNTRGNCWRYATCQPVPPNSSAPDQRSGFPVTPPFDCSQLAAQLGADACNMMDTDPPNTDCPAWSYRICYMGATGQRATDAHFVRRETDGSWTHKQGITPPRDTDCASPPARIVDPGGSNWNCSSLGGLNYTFCGCFCRRFCQ